MRIRWKILILLLAITLIPMLVLRLNGYLIFMEVGRELGQSARNTLLHRTTLEMERMVEDHAVVLGRTSRLLGTVLRSERSGVESILHDTFGASPYLSQQDELFSIADGGKLAPEYCMEIGSGQCTPLSVDYSGLWVRRSRGRGMQGPLLDGEQKKQLLEVLQGTRHPVADLVLWSVVRFDGGTEVVYPSAGRIWIPRHRTWVFGEEESRNKPSWSRPYLDPVTRQVVITVFMPFVGGQGFPSGRIGLVIPLDVLQHNPEHIRNLSPDAEFFVVRLETDPASGNKGLRVSLKGEPARTEHRHWVRPEEEEWLSSPDHEQFARMVHNLDLGQSGVTSMPFKGVPSLWGYAGAGSRNSLLFVVPEKDAVADAKQAEEAINSRFQKMGRYTGMIFLLVIVATMILSLVVARMVGFRLKQLVDGVRAIARGNYNVRVNIETRDEIGELARSFNEMAPALLERERIKESLNLAMQIQQRLLPGTAPDFPGLDVAGMSRYCDETGGDYYDYFTITCQETPRLGLAVGDVSGHGIPSALLMVSVRGFLRSRLALPGCLGEVVTDVNRLVAADTFGGGTFMTFLFLVVDPLTGVLRWVRAGHDPAMVYDPESDTFEELFGAGLPLGVVADTRYEEAAHAPLMPGQILFLGTDGIWETRSPSGEMFGKDRLRAVLRGARDASAPEIVSAVVEAVDGFREGERQRDDVTMIVLKKE
jgi:sigma-B regulation protein RsbU (phosphoserine phosphatase)